MLSPMIVKEIPTEQGTMFMSWTLRKLDDLLGIKLICTSISHLQMGWASRMI